MRHRQALFTVAAITIMALSGMGGCGGTATDPDGGEGASPDAEAESGLALGKADGFLTACAERAIVLLVNDPEVTDAYLKAGGVHTRARRNLLANRPFPGIEAVDATPWVGPAAFRALAEMVRPTCESAPAPTADVIMSPQEYSASHLARVASIIESSFRSLDVAMYSFRDEGIFDALERAAARGVSIRMIFEAASKDRSSPEGTRSARLEDMGVDVRWINKIMHHKFVIVDGPRDNVTQALNATLATGSANWSSSAGTRFDENTVFIQGSIELPLRFQREFNHLWESSRPLDWNPALQFFASAEVGPELAGDEASVDAVFTSANFEVKQSSRYGPTFSVIRGRSVVAERLVQLIAGAERAIHVASGHLRSRPVAEALMAKAVNAPHVDIRVYLDGQEYISSWYHGEQETKLQTCLASAGGSETRTQSCYDKGFLFGYALHLGGIPVRYKYYAYRWDYTYAPQMHHKYMVIDGATVASGSYNLSDNAEHNTMENVVIYGADEYPGLVEAFEENFETLWRTGEAEGLYDDLLADVEGGTGSVPLVFDPMALQWEQVSALKRALKDACPAVNSESFRRNPGAHKYCDR